MCGEFSLECERTCSAHTSHCQRTWNVPAAHLQRTVNAPSAHMRNACSAHTARRQRKCITHAESMKNIQRTCNALVVHVHVVRLFSPILRTCASIQGSFATRQNTQLGVKLPAIWTPSFHCEPLFLACNLYIKLNDQKIACRTYIFAMSLYFLPMTAKLYQWRNKLPLLQK